MSHIVQIKTEVRDVTAINLACRRLQLDAPRFGEAKLFASRVTGHAVQLSEWNYPIVSDVTTGHVHYDNFGGSWGDKQKLDQFLQIYAVEKAKLEARRRGHSCIEQTLPDGRIKVTICVGGAA